MIDSMSPENAHGAVVLACTACGQRWLVAGVVAGEHHTCKSCGHTFLAAPARMPARPTPQLPTRMRRRRSIPA